MSGDRATPSGDVWRVELAPGVVRSLDRLPEKSAAAVVEFITATLPTDPYRMSKPLRAPLGGWRSARRGSYRVIFELIEPDRVLHVGRVDHRADAYRGGSIG